MRHGVEEHRLSVVSLIRHIQGILQLVVGLLDNLKLLNLSNILHAELYIHEHRRKRQSSQNIRTTRNNLQHWTYKRRYECYSYDDGRSFLSSGNGIYYRTDECHKYIGIWKYHLKCEQCSSAIHARIIHVEKPACPPRDHTQHNHQNKRNTAQCPYYLFFHK